eukprot:m.287046 g.287046  ORF g.287046 m.287046 type:complete len:153 (+) comp55007_c0_seq3:102-560(+)
MLLALLLCVAVLATPALGSCSSYCSATCAGYGCYTDCYDDCVYYCSDSSCFTYYTGSGGYSCSCASLAVGYIVAIVVCVVFFVFFLGCWGRWWYRRRYVVVATPYRPVYQPAVTVVSSQQSYSTGYQAPPAQYQPPPPQYAPYQNQQYQKQY